jgi:hypothetical protein
MTTRRRFPLVRLLGLGAALMLAGCATTEMNVEWRDPAFSGASLTGGRVLVVCRAPDEAIRRVCEDRWATQLGAQNVASVRSYSIPGFPWASEDSSAEMQAAARASGAAALAATSLYPSEVVVVHSGPQVGIGVGGGSGGGFRGGGFGFGGIGISLPVGSPTATQGLVANSSLMDVASGKVVWSGSASAPPSGDAVAQLDSLTQVTIQALRKAGLI